MPRDVGAIGSHGRSADPLPDWHLLWLAATGSRPLLAPIFLTCITRIGDVRAELRPAPDGGPKFTCVTHERHEAKVAIYEHAVRSRRTTVKEALRHSQVFPNGCPWGLGKTIAELRGSS